MRQGRIPSLRRLCPEAAQLLEGYEYTLEPHSRHLILRIRGVAVLTIPRTPTDYGRRHLNAMACIRRHLRSLQ